ncbi:acetylornithine carbamoyltransferase [Cellulophaga lytica]|uniref:N-succinylornithine carbamoyltransferase n=1 Tax=Cellulophaga lytica (strain ATCC 23178 / DSM 7489 / JCM 8516 / NBRC 14961 / NCIMB 1423 / VKM B-1433 / Cy l20) TaxID=867900 RepID=F0RCX1_CELLC|nr:acetylornithine carbamoyltransferase [Cellulophaga lytica]ADY28658.1 N-acetylornithine carbamoyltransferase [Cellulophaga lytica DSM 7489]AIM59710.1 acetylornithine carbamoyltransferase [Cellulophaga lytica]WQG77163.1 acetylornithine carbamoyltransferase [Cellulophaga lytica]
MKNYVSITNIDSLPNWVDEALEIKKNPKKYKNLGEDKTIVLLFFNNSLRTRLSTQKAAQNLGMEVIVMNFGSEGWTLEFTDGTVMDQGKSEHVKEAAQVVSQYCDVIGIRAFANLQDKEEDEAELVINGFIKHATVPILNMESSVGHPLQALADAITLAENNTKPKPKVVLSWAPHPKALPHAVANSFIEMMHLQDADFVITHPKGYELNTNITKGATIEYDQEKALENADFVYVKNWSSYQNYGQVLNQDKNWTITLKKLGAAKFMHCLPVRRNVIVEDAVLDSNQSLVIEQANNRTFAAQIALKKILENQ